MELKALRAKKSEGAEWRDCDISDLCQLQRGFDITEATRKAGTVPVYSSSGLSYFHNEARLKPLAVITGRKGILGKVFLVKEPCWPHDTTLWVRDFKDNDPEYVYRFLSQFKLERFDAATSVPTLNRNNLVNIPICLPPLAAQRAIAGVLGDVDALIGALDRLIAKKRDLKQAAMQQLLTGQTRLPGFDRSRGSLRQSSIGTIPSDWDVKPLRDGVQLLSGHHVLAQYCNTKRIGFPYITGPSDFPKGQIQHTKYTERPTTICRAGDILVTVKGSGSGTTVLADAEYCISRQLMAIRLLEWDVNFVHASLTQDESVFGAGAAGLIPGLSRADILDKEIAVPSLPEQTAIASVLSDMDSELSALARRRDKTHLLKQGMMQELLTGRIRLS